MSRTKGSKNRQNKSNQQSNHPAKATVKTVEQAPVEGKLTEDQVKNIAPVSDEDHIKGNKDARIILIEYSDLECSYCADFHATAQQIKDEYGDVLEKLADE